MIKKIITFSLLILSNSLAQDLRPVRDNVGFCWDYNEMKNFISYLDSIYENPEFEKENLIAAISVHDDYLYAGKVYYPLFKLINAKEVVIFGVTHGTVRKELNPPTDVLIFDEYKAWKGIYNDVKISPLRDIIKSKLNKKYFVIYNKAHEIEHSIEALIPFLQFYNPEVKITPIMVTQMSMENVEKISRDLSLIISDYIKTNKLKLGKDIFILMSNDANHYGEDFNNSPYGLDLSAHQKATEQDKEIINNYLVGILNKTKIQGLASEIIPDDKNEKAIPLWCGRYPIIFGLITLMNINDHLNLGRIKGRLFNYSDTFSEKVLPFKKSSMGLTAPFSLKHWVGFFTLGFYLE